MRFGMHLSMSGRMADAPEHGKEIGCRALQIFSGNPRGWSKPPLDPSRVEEFRAAVRECGIEPVVVHSTYLINLAAPDAPIYKLSVETFLDELRRSWALGAKFYVVHCGSHKGTGEDGGRARICKALQRAHAEVPERPEILLENTAGTANSLGTTFQDLALLLDGAAVPRTGICFDTCHALAAGYEIRTREGVAETLDELDRVLSLQRLRCLHVNDSKGGLGSHLDRHENIGQGEIGAEGFRHFFSDRRLWDLPAILETPLDQPDDDRHDLWKIVELAAEAGAVGRDLLERMPTGPQEVVGAMPELVSNQTAVVASKPRARSRRTAGALTRRVIHRPAGKRPRKIRRTLRKKR